MKRESKKPIIGQEAICPDGLGRVSDFCVVFPHEYVEISIYVRDRRCRWSLDSVELIDPRNKSS